MNQSEIDRSARETVNELMANGMSIFETLPVDFVYLGGSYAREEVHVDSDLDLFLSIKNYSEITTAERYELLNKIFTALDGLKVVDVDIQFFQACRMDIQLRVLREGKLVFDRDPNQRTDYIEKIMNLGFDFEIWLHGYVNSAIEGQND